MKRIMRYLVYTPKFELWYSKGSTFDLIGYSYADYAGCKIDSVGGLPLPKVLKNVIDHMFSV
jgi:hypothetical protein